MADLHQGVIASHRGQKECDDRVQENPCTGLATADRGIAESGRWEVVPPRPVIHVFICLTCSNASISFLAEAVTLVAFVVLTNRMILRSS